MSDTLFDTTEIPAAPEIPAVQTADPVVPARKRKSYYVPVSQRVAADNKTAAKRAADRKAEKKAVRKGTVVTKKGIASLKIVAKAAAKKHAAKDEPKGASWSGEAVCSICHKPLSKHTSVQNGMGDTCANKIKLLPAGTTLEEHYEKLSADEVPEGYLKLKDAIAKLNDKNISTYRVLQAVGGDRMLRKPLNSHFKVVIVAGTRYINGASIKNYKDLIKV